MTDGRTNTFPTTVDDSYLDLILQELDFEFQTSPAMFSEKLKEFMEEPEHCLYLLQRAIQNMLLHTHQSQTFLFQAVDDSRWTPLLCDLR